MKLRRRGVLPGFGLSMGVSLTFLGLVVLVPLTALFLQTSTLDGAAFVRTVTDRRAMAAYELSFGASLIGALLNAIFGLLGAPLARAGIDVAFTRLGVVVVLTFVGLPFVVRTVQPVLAELDPDLEEAAAVLGATRWQAFRLVVVRAILPALLTGFALAFARALGEYGSVVFISGNMPLSTEIVPLLIVTKLEQYDYGGATAIAVVMLVASFTILICINLLEVRTRRGRRR